MHRNGSTALLSSELPYIDLSSSCVSPLVVSAFPNYLVQEKEEEEPRSFDSEVALLFASSRLNEKEREEQRNHSNNTCRASASNSEVVYFGPSSQSIAFGPVPTVRRRHFHLDHYHHLFQKHQKRGEKLNHIPSIHIYPSPTPRAPNRRHSIESLVNNSLNPAIDSSEFDTTLHLIYPC